jgi:hypothetical protein
LPALNLPKDGSSFNMSRMKYVIIDGISPIIFSESQNHSDFKVMGQITGAGFCNIYEDTKECETKAHVFGKSTSLGIESTKEDERILCRFVSRY